MKYKFDIQEISKERALEMVTKFHYSNTLPTLNKIFLGFFLEGELVGMVTLGWGTRPLHTIKKLFPSLDTKDYFEIGRMCMTEDMPRNSESQMLSQMVKWLKVNKPKLKVIFTWADGMLGKVGYVYQASNFLYAGQVESEIYLHNGVKIHPRQTKALFGLEGDKRKTVRPSWEQMQEHGIKHYKGNQFRYLLFLCNKKEKKKLMKEALVDLSYNYPKEDALSWKVKVGNRAWQKCPPPNYITDRKFNKNEDYLTEKGHKAFEKTEFIIRYI
ncbi:TPA: hypothetical protein K8M77_000335 [Clostridium perfringens]|nr:hypothetical protein [Clostridium perfringens]